MSEFRMKVNVRNTIVRKVGEKGGTVNIVLRNKL